MTLTLGAQGLRWKQGCMLSWVLPFCLKEHIFHVIISNSQDRWRSYLNRLMILPTILTLLHQYFPQQNSCALCTGCTIKTKEAINNKAKRKWMYELSARMKKVTRVERWTLIGFDCTSVHQIIIVLITMKQWNIFNNNIHLNFLQLYRSLLGPTAYSVKYLFNTWNLLVQSL